MDQGDKGTNQHEQTHGYLEKLGSSDGCTEADAEGRLEGTG